jgi:hypothetical protein
VRHVLVRDSGQAISGLNTRLSRVDWVISLVSTTTGQRELNCASRPRRSKRSLTSESKKGKRRRRSPGGSMRRASVLRIEQTLAISAFQPSPRRI